MTPLTGALNSLAPATAAAAGRGGLAIAVSSGLVAGIPASGVALGAQHELAVQTASLPVTATPTGSSAALSSAPVTAPAGAEVSFERSAFRAVGRHAAPASTSTAAAARGVSQVSRSLARAAYRAQIKRAPTRPRVVTPTTTRTTTGAARVTTPAASAPSTPGSVGSATGSSVVAVALRYLGVPYVYGGTSPRGFDCSGFSQYVYGLLGVTIPRTAQQQYNAARRIPRSQAVAGDLVFFFSGGTVSHMGIYLGGNMMVAAPHTGDVVKKEQIYSANVAFGRF